MAIRRALLIVPLLLAAAGWAGARRDPAASRVCGGCHETHGTEHGSCADCHRGDPAALRKEIAHHRLLTGRAAAHARPGDPAVPEGERLVERLACRRCHVVAGAGNRLATDLDRVVRQRDQEELKRSLFAPAENMPRFGLEERQIETALAFLLRSADPDRAEASYRIRFAKLEAKDGSVFDEHCGGCHRALTPGGPLGRSSAGPNLSGLLSPYYPRTVGHGTGWSERDLDLWIENPRALRPDAAMRPVRVGGEARLRLADELRTGGSDGPGEKPSAPGRAARPADGHPD